VSLTRANTELLLVARVGPLLVAAGMDGTTVDGTNTDLNDPIGYAIRALGHLVDSAVLVDNDDVARVTVTETDEFLDVATLSVLRNILGNLDDVDITVGPRSEKLSQLAMQVERRVVILRTRMILDYGYGMASPKAGYITMDIAEHD